MKKLNYEKLMACNPFEIDEIINARDQKVTFIEHPSGGDLSQVIAVFKGLKLAFETDFFETDDMMASHGEYTPAYMHGECKSQWEFDLCGNKLVGEFELDKFILDLQELSPIVAIGEIATSGLTDKEIAICIRTISNSNFKFKKQ